MASVLLFACEGPRSPPEEAPEPSPPPPPASPEVEPAVELASAALRAQGEAEFARRNWESAKSHYEAALEHAVDEPVEQAAAHVALARLAERRGLGDEASDHVGRAHALSPSTYTEHWLAGGRDCGLEVLANGGTLATVETWRSASARLQVDAGLRLRKSGTDAAAQRSLCGERDCTGSGPWIVGLSGSGEPIEYLAVLVPRPDGALAMLADRWYSNPSWPCNYKNRLVVGRIDASEQAIHLRVERSNAFGEWHSCSGEDDFDGCVEYCRVWAHCPNRSAVRPLPAPPQPS